MPTLDQFQRDIDELLRGPGDDYFRLRCIRIYTEYTLGRVMPERDMVLLELIIKFLQREIDSRTFIQLSHED